MHQLAFHQSFNQSGPPTFPQLTVPGAGGGGDVEQSKGYTNQSNQVHLRFLSFPHKAGGNGNVEQSKGYNNQSINPPTFSQLPAQGGWWWEC